MPADPDPNPYVVTYQQRPNAAVRLLCFAHAGGGASAFNTWHRELPPSIEVCAVQLPGRETRRKERFASEIDALVTQLLTSLAPLHDRPVALFGYSLGTLLAFEYARALRRSGGPAPLHLTAAAANAPPRAGDIRIHELPEAEFIRELEIRYDGIPRMIRDDRDLMAYFLPVIRADLALRSTYRYREEPPLSCPILALGGASDPRVTVGELEQWGAQTTGAFASRVFPGGHFFIASLRTQVLALLAQSLSATAAAMGVRSHPASI